LQSRLKELEAGIRQKEDIIHKLTNSSRDYSVSGSAHSSAPVVEIEKVKTLESEVQSLRRRLQSLLSSSPGDISQRQDCERMLKARQSELEEARRSVIMPSTGSTRNSIGSFEESEMLRKELFSMQSGKQFFRCNRII